MNLMQTTRHVVQEVVQDIKHLSDPSKMSSNVEKHQRMLKEHSDANIDMYVQTSTFKGEIEDVSVAVYKLVNHWVLLTPNAGYSRTYPA
jgi:hypothetical protein